MSDNIASRHDFSQKVYRPRPRILIRPMVLFVGEVELKAQESGMMKRVRLGKSELMVSRVGFGGISITRVSYEEAERCIHAAIDLGVNFIDTATGYYDSEEKIGRAIKGRRDNLIIATKAPPSTPAEMNEAIDKSLKRLQIETIDLYQFHLVKDEETLKKSLNLLPILEKARDQGKIQHIGVTVHGVDFINQVIETDAFETVMIALNFIVCEAAETALPNALGHDLGVIAMKPMAGGHIEDPYLAFKYFINLENVVPIVGIETPEQIKEVAQILEDNIPPTSQEIEEMETVRRESGNRFCRRCGYCMPCEQGVRIIPATIIKSLGKRLPPKKLITENMAAAMQSLENCIQCRKCEDKCPYDLDVLEMLEENKAYYDELCEQLGSS